MPDSDGKLSTPEKEKVSEWLKEQWKNWACPFSGHNQWKLGDFLVHTPQFTPGVGLVVGGPVFPSVVVICSGCGYQVLINAVMIGLVPSLETLTKEGNDA